MIYGTGTDMIEIERVLDACERESFLNRIFTERERREAAEHKKRLAGDFAVKEAVAKAFGTGFRTFMPADIEVTRNALGKPEVTLYGAALAFAEEHHICNIQVSITDTKELAMAFAIAESLTE